MALGVLCAKIALVVLVFDPLAVNVFSQPKALVGQALACVLLGVLVALALRYGRAMLVRSPLHVPVAAFALVYVLAAIFALDHRVALWGAPDRGLGLVATLDNVLVYLSVVALVRTGRDLLWLGATVAGTTVVLLAYAVMQKMGLDPIPWASGIVETRSFATTGNPGVLGQFMATIAVAAAGFALLATETPSRVRALGAAVATCAVIGTLLAGARSTLIGLGLGGAVLTAFVLTDRVRAQQKGRSLRVALLGLALAIGTLSVIAGGRIVGSSALSFGELLAGGSVTGRFDIYRVAVEEVRDRPLLGVGPDNYVVAFPRYRSADAVRVHESDAAQTSTHSWPLKIATDAGVVGLVGFGAIGLTAAVLLFRRERRGPAIAAGLGLVAFFATASLSINHVATDWMPWLGIAVIAAHTTREDIIERPRVVRGRRRDSRGTGPPALATIVGTGAIVVGLLLGSTSIRIIQGAHWAEVARRAYAKGQQQLPSALAAAQQAVNSDPDRASYWNILGLTQLAQQRYAEATRSFERASGVAPYEHTYLTNLALAQLGLGLHGSEDARADALATARRAAAMDPNVIQVLYLLALAAEENGDHEEAAAASERAIELGEPSARLAYVAARAYMGLGRPSDAQRWLDAGLRNNGRDVDLLLLSAEMLLQRGDRATAADLLARVAIPGESERAARLQRRLIATGVQRVVLEEAFADLPHWTLEGGQSIGVVQANMLTVPPAEWRVVLGAADGTGVRVSVQFRLPSPSGLGSFDVGRWVDRDNAIYVSQLSMPPEIRLVRREGGSLVQLAARPISPLVLGDWYWLEFDVRDQQVTAILYHSGGAPSPKGAARVMGALSANVPENIFRSGPAFIASDLDPPVQIGGIRSRPGGVYIER